MSSGSRRNVVVLMLDTLRKDRVSAYNEEVDFTPNFESLAEESIKYNHANAQAPWTLPSVASILTGEYPWEHEATHQKTYLEVDKDTLPERFLENGYTTKLVTSNTWISPSIGMAEGFEDVENFLGIAEIGFFKKISKTLAKAYNMLDRGKREKIAHIINLGFERFMDQGKSRQAVDEAKEFLEGADDNFFLFINILSAHEPYGSGDPPAEYLKKHGLEDSSKVPKTDREYFEGEYRTEDLEKAYDAAVDYTDDLVGEIRESLSENNLEEDTVFVVLSDHGQAVGKEDIFGHQFTVMDRVIETPLLIRRPGGQSGEEDSLFELRQLYKLIPDLAGISDEEIEQNENVKGGYEFPDFVSKTIPDNRRKELYRRLRYVKNRQNKLVKSTDEDQNVTYDYRKEKEECGLREVLEDIEGVKQDSGTEVDDEKVKERLEDLGYI